VADGEGADRLMEILVGCLTLGLAVGFVIALLG
jgi:hypothetical protein